MRDPGSSRNLRPTFLTIFVQARHGVPHGGGEEGDGRLAAASVLPRLPATSATTTASGGRGRETGGGGIARTSGQIRFPDGYGQVFRLALQVTCVKSFTLTAFNCKILFRKSQSRTQQFTFKAQPRKGIVLKYCAARWQYGGRTSMK